MEESNIYFVPNTLNYGGEYTGPTINKFNAQKGDEKFFRQIMDYGALMKLKKFPRMYGGLNSSYYAANIKQVRVVDPEFSGVMVGLRKKDPKILAENARNDEEYGYPQDNDYYPLLEEVIIDNKEFTYADKLLGKWEETDHGLNSSDADPFGLFVKQRIEADLSDDTVNPNDVGFEDIEDNDPYYYIYEEAAGAKKKVLGDIDKAKLYTEKYGSIFRAFEEVPQTKIIQAPIDQWTFVNAGPGTGKTYTLMKKITYMIEELEADPEEIWVLCFTNAAVNEIKARIKKYADEEGDRSFINVDVRTFHSFAWLMISQANEVFSERSNYRFINLMQLNYDQSIRKATELIRNFGEEVFGGCSHLIIDEIQDLTNERAYLVMTMVRECMKYGVGVTILGDSCQAIYDYSDEETVFELKSNRFYKYMFSDFYERGKFYKLEKSHRQTERLINIGSPLRKAILAEKKDTVRETIKGLKNKIPTIMTGSLSVKLSERSFNQITENGTLCLMCRNNAQVLATSTNLRKRGIRHVVNAYNEFEYLAGWIGKVFGLFTKQIITFNEFSRLIGEFDGDNSPEKIWKRLQELIGSENNVLKVSDVLKSVARSKVDDPIFRNVPKSNLLVSNIHRSKGREYDAVILEQKFINRLVNDSSAIKSPQEYIGEAKTLYVAVTRPRTELYINSLATADVTLKKIKTGRKRWVRGDGRNLKTIEIRALSDADINSYNTADLQEYIINNVSEGDEITLVLDSDSMNVQYNIMHSSEKGVRVIGKTSAEFIEDVDAIITPYKSPWPRRITDLYVSGIHSQISTDCSRVWCWVDFCGLGSAHNDIY